MDHRETSAAAESRTVEYRELLRYLPQRYPFLLLDRITAFEAHRWARGVKNVAALEPLLVGPGKSVWPTGLIVESIGQLAIALFNISHAAEKPVDIVLGSVSDVAIDRRVGLGCRLDLYAEVVKELDNGFVFSGYAEVAGDRVLTLGSLIAMEKPAAPGAD